MVFAPRTSAKAISELEIDPKPLCKAASRHSRTYLAKIEANRWTLPQEESLKPIFDSRKSY